MKVIHLISGGDTGGAKTHVHSLLHGLDGKVELTMVCFMEGPFAQEARELGISTVVLPGHNIPGTLRILKKMIRDGGYDIIHDLDGVLTEFDRVIGLHRLKAIHLNDSKNPLGARKDRHACIGEGCIGLEALTRVVRHPALNGLPFCLETPNELPGYAREIALMRKQAE